VRYAEPPRGGTSLRWKLRSLEFRTESLGVRKESQGSGLTSQTARIHTDRARRRAKRGHNAGGGGELSRGRAVGYNPCHRWGRHDARSKGKELAMRSAFSRVQDETS
jgi:hypothetical protein